MLSKLHLARLTDHFSVNVPFQETWTEIEKFVDKGLAKNIGLRYVSEARQLGAAEMNWDS